MKYRSCETSQFTLILFAMLASACAQISPPVQGTASVPTARAATFTPFKPQTVTPIPGTFVLPLDGTKTPAASTPAAAAGVTPTFRPQAPGGRLSIWVDAYLPAALRESLALQNIFEVVVTNQAQEAEAQQSALRLEVGDEHLVSRWTYALVAPFPTLPQGVSTDDLRRAWSGEGLAPGSPAGHFEDRPLLVDEGTYRVLAARWGEPGTGRIEIHPSGELLDFAWNHRPSWAIVPFEALEPRWKVLEVDGLSPLRKEFDPAAYSLSVPISLNGDQTLVGLVRTLYGAETSSPLVPPTNRDPNRLTVLAMTGVTALVRATAFAMEQHGVKYPGRDVGDWLRSADLTHISNEVPFAKNCPYPNPLQPDMRFCSDPRYIALLEDVGTDIVELTGDHFQDWGIDAMYYTLDLYRERGWLYYGGGSNLAEGRRALMVEHNGNRLAFIGCNAKGGSFAQASPGRPGAVVCDYDWMRAEIAHLRQDGYLPIVTFQHYEYYTYQAQPNQKRDFRGAAQAGAVIVSGSQAHQPQALEFVNGALIHYGLGNLFFDQYDVSLASRQAFIDRHVFYNGRYIGTELLPIMFVDYARPRPMTPAEREQLLEEVFLASGW